MFKFVNNIIVAIVFCCSLQSQASLPYLDKADTENFDYIMDLFDADCADDESLCVRCIKYGNYFIFSGEYKVCNSPHGHLNEIVIADQRKFDHQLECTLEQHRSLWLNGNGNVKINSKTLSFTSDSYLLRPLVVDGNIVGFFTNENRLLFTEDYGVNKRGDEFLLFYNLKRPLGEEKNDEFIPSTKDRYKGKTGMFKNEDGTISVCGYGYNDSDKEYIDKYKLKYEKKCKKYVATHKDVINSCFIKTMSCTNITTGKKIHYPKDYYLSGHYYDDER
jgi:hypothetical protein